MRNQVVSLTLYQALSLLGFHDRVALREEKHTSLGKRNEQCGKNLDRLDPSGKDRTRMPCFLLKEALSAYLPLGPMKQRKIIYPKQPNWHELPSR